jgi:hypothetical protein
MTIRQSSPRRTAFSASNVVDAIAVALTEIKHDDCLTDADIGALLGKCDDQAAKYRTGLATMDAVTFGRAKREWGGRFTGYFDRLCENSRHNVVNDQIGQTSILAAALAMSVALQDGNVSEAEVLANRAILETARDAISDQLAKLRPGVAA